jgi:hypothetical protein
MRNTSTKLLVIAIIAAVTTITMSAASPAFAAVNCTDNPDGTTTCSGGASFSDRHGGFGGRHIFDELIGREAFTSGGFGSNIDDSNIGDFVGGAGQHKTCSPSSCPDAVGGLGQHLKGPGGNSDK